MARPPLTCILAMILTLWTGQPARALGPAVVADIAPTHSLVARVMQGVGAPRLLIPRTSTVRDFTLSRADARLLAEANLVFFVGRRLTPALSRPYTTLSRKVYFIELSEVPGLPLPRPGPGDAALDGVSPQFWLNPEVARIWLPVIADALAERDPANSQTYRANADAAQQELEAMEEAIADRLRPFTTRGYAVPDDSFAHFEHAFRLNRAMLAPPGSLAPEGLGARMAEAGIACLFLPPGGLSPALAEALAAADLRAGDLDSMGTGLELGPDLYPALIERIAASFESCLAARP